MLRLTSGCVWLPRLCQRDCRCRLCPFELPGFLLSRLDLLHGFLEIGFQPLCSDGAFLLSSMASLLLELVWKNLERLPWFHFLGMWLRRLSSFLLLPLSLPVTSLSSIPLRSMHLTLLLWKGPMSRVGFLQISADLCGLGNYTRLERPLRAYLRTHVGEEAFEADGDDPLCIQASMIEQGIAKSPLLRFDFVEICGGAGVISRAAVSLGLVVAPVLDISESSHYDLRGLRFLEWVVHMVVEGRFASFIIEPPCTSFSCAAYPPVRSYKQPLGFNRTEPRTLHGNTMAFRSFVILKTGRRHRRPNGIEQPRRSKMAWTSFWISLREGGYVENVIASCQFGSIHKKEFLFMLYLIENLEVKCPGGHPHVRVEGKYMKDSAIYPEDLGMHVALGFRSALEFLRRCDEDQPELAGSESVVSNDILQTRQWDLGRCWSWKRKSHINVLETFSSVVALNDHGHLRPDSRVNMLVDSQVAKGALSKGRSSSFVLQPSLKRSCAIQLGFGLYPSWNFAPTRLNTADDPTRDAPIRPPLGHSFVDVIPSEILAEIHGGKFRRFAANWIRLVLLVSYVTPSAALNDCHILYPSFSASAHLPDGLSVGLLSYLHGFCVVFCHFSVSLLDFLGLTRKWICGLSIDFRHWFVDFGFPSCLSGFSLDFLSFATSVTIPSQVSASLPLLSLIFLAWGVSKHFRALSFVASWILLLPSVVAMEPSTAAERDRAAIRKVLNLPADRVVRKQTRDRRFQLLSNFRGWLWKSHGISLRGLLDTKPVDAEMISQWLVAYGRELFAAGKSYGQFSETINSIAMVKPLIKRSLTPAWDLAFAWLADEPHQHHPALPVSILLAMLTICLCWGWTAEAGVLALGWCGLCRIGEILQAVRLGLDLASRLGPWKQFCASAYSGSKDPRKVRQTSKC